MARDHGVRRSAALDAARQGARVPWLLIAAPMALLLFFFALPNALLLSASFVKSEAQQLTRELTLENYAFLFTRALYVWAFIRTFLVGFAVGLIDVALGYPLAYFLVRSRSRWKGLLIALALAPLLASVVVRTYGWYIILNRFGVANDLLLGLGLIDERIAFMPSTGAIIIGLAHALLPYTVLTIMGSLQGINPNLELAAMSLGASRTRTFLNVVLPLSFPGIAGGFILAFSIAISAYATPAILGGPATQVMATAIYGFMTQLLDWSIGAALAVILVVCAMTLAYAAARLGARQGAL
ncbi:MAG TPA: ABC transporter permease [Burkholderiales bacterium]|nr:ABC transporter permease [Burkholderiales bacterium]